MDHRLLLLMFALFSSGRAFADWNGSGTINDPSVYTELRDSDGDGVDDWRHTETIWSDSDISSQWNSHNSFQCRFHARDNWEIKEEILDEDGAWVRVNYERSNPTRDETREFTLQFQSGVVVDEYLSKLTFEKFGSPEVTTVAGAEHPNGAVTPCITEVLTYDLLKDYRHLYSFFTLESISASLKYESKVGVLNQPAQEISVDYTEEYSGNSYQLDVTSPSSSASNLPYSSSGGIGAEPGWSALLNFTFSSLSQMLSGVSDFSIAAEISQISAAELSDQLWEGLSCCWDCQGYVPPIEDRPQPPPGA